MKRLLPLLLCLFPCFPSFAEELPILWLEAGKENEFQTVVDPGKNLSVEWTLRFEHRIIDRGPYYDIGAQAAGHRMLKIKVPPVKPGIYLKATLFFGETPYRDVIIASPDPFEDRKEWFDKHPIALYDPEGTTIELFEQEEMPFTRLRSFADIEAVKRGIVIIGEGTDFDRERGLAELLFEYAANGGIVFLVAPEGSIPLVFPGPIRAILMKEEPKHLFLDASVRGKGKTLALSTANNQVILISKWDRRHDFCEGKGRGTSNRA